MNALSQKAAGERAKTRGKTQAAGTHPMGEQSGDTHSNQGPTKERWELALETIMNRLEKLEKLDQLEEIRDKMGAIATLDGKIDKLTGTTNEFIAQTRDDLDTLAGMLEDGRKQQEASSRACTILEHRVAEAEHENKQLHMIVNGMQNKSKECNIRMDGKREDEREDLKDYVLQLAKKITRSGAGLDPSAIVTAHRLGKKPSQHNDGQNAVHRPRPILVTFRSIQDRNELYYSRTKLRNYEEYKHIYLNDDVTAATRKVREDYRAVATLVRNNNKEVRIHDDGLVIEGRKYKYEQADQLPPQYTIQKARTVRMDGGLYFHSAHSVLSNFHPAPIIQDGVYYPTAEHCYQAEKCRAANDRARHDLVIKARTPLEAKKIGEQIKETDTWRETREEVMKMVVDLKFNQNQELARYLMDTRDFTLHEATSNDHYGIGATLNSRSMRNKQYKGKNRLGAILEAKRADLRAEHEDDNTGSECRNKAV